MNTRHPSTAARPHACTTTRPAARDNDAPTWKTWIGVPLLVAALIIVPEILATLIAGAF